MSRRCDLNKSKGVLSGNKVSHSNRKTRRRFLPNLQEVSFYSEALKKVLKLRLAPHTIRSVEHNDGIDNFLLSSAAKDLTEEALKLRRLIQKKLATA